MQAVVAAMRPYARRLLASGVPFGQLEARLRELFVEVAQREIVASGAQPTDSAISVLTGVNRKEVRRIRALDRSAAPRAFSRSLVATLVSRWTADRRTTDRNGRPLPLPYDAKRGPTFVSLARKTTADLHPRALLDVMIGAGAAELREGDVVALTRAAYVPQRGRPEALAMLADDPPELIDTMLHNVLDDGGAPRLQQKLSYDNIGTEGLAKLQAALRREAEKFLRRANAHLQRHDRDRAPRAPGGERATAGIGVYYFETGLPAATPTQTRKSVARKRIRKRRVVP